MIIKKIYEDYNELKKEHEYFSRECYRKEERIRKHKKTIRELEKRIADLETENKKLKKELEVFKNEKKSKRKNNRLFKAK